MQSQFIQTRDLRMHYLQQGTGFPIIMVHGFPETSFQWRHQLPALAETNAVFALDTRGFGQTDKPRIRVNRDMLARDVINFMDALGIERAHLVGHDWGGIIGFKAVIDYQERFERVAFIDTLLTTWIPWGFHGCWFKDEPRPEEFFAAHHEEFIQSIFAGKQPSYAGWPYSGFGGGAPLTDDQLRARAATRSRTPTPTRTSGHSTSSPGRTRVFMFRQPSTWLRRSDGSAPAAWSAPAFGPSPLEPSEPNAVFHLTRQYCRGIQAGENP